MSFLANFEILFTIMLFLFPLVWIVVVLKKILFWLYLWQLKEYHVGRFLDHFQTFKGRQIMLHKPDLAKIFLFLCISFISFFPLSLFRDQKSAETTVIVLLIGIFIIYILEGVRVVMHFSKKIIKLPIFTKKVIFLLLILFAATVFFPIVLLEIGFGAPISILLFDILVPPIVSSVVLLFQPLTVLARNQMIKKAIEKRNTFENLLTIGITGSYGKTSTKEFLHAILAEKFGQDKVLKTKEHQNSEVGVSQCILNELNSLHEIFVCEMGAYGRGGIKLLCDIAKPKIGILTGINEQHMATFGSQENITKTKYELIESLPSDGIAFFNAKNEHCLELYNKTKIKKFLYGQASAYPGEENILGAMEAGKELGMTDEEIAKAVEKIENRFGGIQLKEGVNGINITEADYSANPTGTIAHLEYLKNLKGKKVIVMPCLIELGKSSKEVHKRIGRKIGEVCDLAIIVTKDRIREIQEGAVEKGMKNDNILFAENPRKIIDKVKAFCSAGDVVLLEGRLPKEIASSLIR